jgi:hypothetical protein
MLDLSLFPVCLEARRTPGTTIRLSAFRIPLAACALAGLLPSLASARDLRPTNPAAEILARCARALGGEARLAQIRSLTVAGVLEEGGLHGRIEEWVTARGQHRLLRTHDGLDTTLRVFDGRRGWIRDWNGRVHALAGADLENEVADVFAASFAYLLPGRAGSAPRLLGDDGTGALSVVEVAPRGGRTIRFAFEKSTGLPVRLERANGDNTLTLSFADWREIDGVKLPFLLRRSTGDPRADVVVRLEIARCNGTPPRGAFARPRDTARPGRFGAGRHVVSLPLTTDSGFLLLQAQVNRSEPLWFLLDTGASLTVLNRDRAGELGIPLQGELAIGTSGGSTGMAIARGVSFEVPGAEVEDQTVGAISLAAFEAGLGLRMGGILGYDFLNRFVVELDLEASVIRLHDPRRYRYRGRGQVLPLTLENDSNPFVRASLTTADGRTIAGKLEIDSGETKALFLNAPFVEAQRLLNASDKPAAQGAKATEKRFFTGVSTKGQLARLKLGHFAITDVPAGFSLSHEGFVGNPDYAGLIGNAVLSRFRVVLDETRQRLILEPNRRFGEPFAPRQTYGAQWIAEGAALDVYRIAAVLPHSPADDAGLRAGDVLVELDGQPATSLTLNRLRQAFEKEGRKLRLGLRRGEESLEIELAVHLVPVP